MPLESRATSVLSPDERMCRRGLIKQITKRAGLGHEVVELYHFFLFLYSFDAERRERNKAICTNVVWRAEWVGCVLGAGGVVWSQFEMHGKAAGKRPAGFRLQGQIYLTAPGRFNQPYTHLFSSLQFELIELLF